MEFAAAAPQSGAGVPFRWLPGLPSDRLRAGMDSSRKRPGALSISNVTKAALYMTAAAFCFAFMNSLVRVASQSVPTLEVVFFRNLFALVALLPWMMSSRGQGLRTAQLRLHLIRAVVGVTAMIVWFIAVVQVPLADAVALNFTLPLFVVIGAALALGERVGPRRWAATAVGFSGMLVILRPGFAEVSPASVLPVLAAIFMATSMLLLKRISAKDRAGTSVAYMSILMTPLSLVPALFVWQWPSLEALGVLALLGTMAMLAHLCLARGMGHADASVVMLFDYARLPFVAFFAFVLFGEAAEFWTWAGAGIIIASSFYIARREAAAEKSARPLETARAAGEI